MPFKYGEVTDCRRAARIEVFAQRGKLPSKERRSYASLNYAELLRLKSSLSGGLPPFKDEHFSIRNQKHPNYNDFKRLLDEAIKAMNGMAWYFGPVHLDFVLFSPDIPKKSLVVYVGGIMDTLDGSSGPQFTYLPIVFEDDCQVVSSKSAFQKSVDTWYALEISFL